jgi:hypothetical protein
MKIALYTLVTSLLLAPLAVGQHQHGQAKPDGQPMMMQDHQAAQTLLDQAAAAFDEAATATDPTQRERALESGRQKLAEFRETFNQHRAEMAEHIKSCPMMKKKKPGDGHQHQH